MSPEDGAPKPITPRRTAFAILFTMRPTSTRSLLPSSSRGLNPRSPFSLPLHFVCLFPQLPHIQKQSHQIPILPIPRLRCTPSTAYARMGGWKGPFRLLSNLPFQRAILSRRTIPTHLPRLSPSHDSGQSHPHAPPFPPSCNCADSLLNSFSTVLSRA